MKTLDLLATAGGFGFVVFVGVSLALHVYEESRPGVALQPAHNRQPVARYIKRVGFWFGLGAAALFLLHFWR